MSTLQADGIAPGPGLVPRAMAFIRFSHTLFALPFALGSCLVAARGFPPLHLLALIILAMVFARTAAMTFNRLADWEIDKRNPRTAGRHKLVSRKTAIAMLLASSAAFIATAAFINTICFILSPVALAIVFFYSLTKRFTSLSHFFLGLALGASPVAAWLAVTGDFALEPFVLAAAVFVWVAGFDVIYATQDADFDRDAGLHSLVIRLGLPRALAIARWLHAVAFLLLILFGVIAQLGISYTAALAVILGALVFEHASLRSAPSKSDLARINTAFFHSNAAVSAAFLAGVIFGIR